MRRMLRGLAVMAGLVAALALSSATASANLTDLWLVNVETGKCMTSDQQPWPASIFQHKCGEPRFNSDVQEWEYRTDEADGPRLISEYNFGSMSIYGSFPYVRTNATQWRTTYNRIRVVEGYHLIKNAGTRQCLSVGSRADGALVYEAPCNVNSRAQMWSFRRPSPSPEEGLWAINVETGKCMTSDQRPWPASTFQHKCGEPRFNADVQRWTWRWEQIGSPNTHLMNEYNSGFTSSHWSFPYVQTDAFQWRAIYKITGIGAHYSRIRNIATDQCVSVGSHADGALVYEAPCNSSSQAQWWSLRGRA